MARWVRSLSVLLLAAVFAPTAFSQAGDVDQTNAATRWYLVAADDGAPIGYASQEVVRRADGEDVVTTQTLVLQERGSPVSFATERTVISKDGDGLPTAIAVTSENGQFHASTRANIADGHAHIVRETPSGRWISDVTLPGDVRFDDGVPLLRTWDPAATPQLAFDNFSIAALGVEHVVIVAAEAATANAPFVATRLRYQGTALIGVSRLTIDHGEITDAARPMFGATMHVRQTSRVEALAAHAPYEVLPNTMTRSPYRITSTAAHIRYRFAFRDGLAFPLPETGEQRADAALGTITVDVCKNCGPGLATDPASLADALRPTAWMQSDNPRLLAIAAPVGRMPLTDERKMLMLVERAHRYFTRIDFVGHYTALDTLRRHAGDCTEAAVLLAALGRSAGIPTRVASGLVYSRESYHGVANAFLPHSWTLAYVDGRWKSFDLALDEFDSTHIALTVGDGDERSIAAAGQLAGLLTLDSMAEVRTRPS